jgi:quinoprotein glucose dehydrogenase
MLRTIDLRTCETVWRTSLLAGGQAISLVYSIDGREYVMIMNAGHHFMGTPGNDSLLAFALPK